MKALLIALLTLSACHRSQPVAPSAVEQQAVVAFGGAARVAVEVAATLEAQQIGLMHRQSLPESHGMLFIFPDESPRSFWMRNTLVPLDMLFLDREHRVVGIVHNAEPLTETPRSVPAPAMYVLEVNAGWAVKHGITTGSQAHFENVK